MTRRLGVEQADGPGVEEMKKRVAPEAVLDAIEEGEKEEVGG